MNKLKKAFCYKKLFWPNTVWINCSSDLKMCANSRPSASNFKSFSRSLEQFFLTVGRNNFCNKIINILQKNKPWIVYLPSGSFPGKASASRSMANVSKVGGIRINRVEISTEASTNSTVKLPMWSAKNSGATARGYCRLCGW